jgi:transposase-like protein
MTKRIIKCPLCECIEQRIIATKNITNGMRKVTYHCPSCKKNWSEMKGLRIGRYYWHDDGHTREHRKIPEGARVKVLGGANTW